MSAFCGFTEGGEGGRYRFSWSNVTISSEHMGQTRRSPVLAAAGLPTRTPSPSLTDPKSEFSETELALGDRRPLPMADTAGERLRRPVAALPRTRPPPGGGRELTGFMAGLPEGSCGGLLEGEGGGWNLRGLGGGGGGSRANVSAEGPPGVVGPRRWGIGGGSVGGGRLGGI